MCTRAFSGNFFAPFVYVVFSRICFYSVNFSQTFCFLCLEMKSNIVYARAKAAILRPSGHSVKEIAKFLTRRNVGASNWSKRESTSNTNQEADDRLFWPIVLENQSRKRSTNRTIPLRTSGVSLTRQRTKIQHPKRWKRWKGDYVLLGKTLGTLKVLTHSMSKHFS